ncbi:T9SS type A sorting domain-containing protein [Winogradskyella forsetii]|uniref:T9SS type A sorting domain-containing protein n=1 Tax=Winogradskyella forsetii TaxID=2686077 RepID=UPI0015BFEE99|nr:T9SS type A sorting domain-containing protein [Winogradskyella forsetii]
MKNLLFIFCIYFITMSSFSQTILGSDIFGESSYDSSGWATSLSASGMRVAIGSPFNDDNGPTAGSVRVFDWNGTSWTQVGPDIDGELDSTLGIDLSLSSDGMRLAIGSAFGGYVRIYDWTGSDWVQVGQDINGETDGDGFGHSLTLSSTGTRVAIGIPYSDENGGNSGSLKVYDWNGTAWIQLGNYISGEHALDNFGFHSIAMSSDGSRLISGSRNNDDVFGNAGQARVFEWNGTGWEQLGPDINGIAPNQESGGALAMTSDGSRIAIGPPFPYTDPLPSIKPQVRVFDWDGTEWIQVGNNIQRDGVFGEFGFSISLSSDGTRLAVGAPAGYSIIDDVSVETGIVHIYDWNGTDWVQFGENINGLANLDNFGGSVSLSSDGEILAIGGNNNDGNGNSSGHVRIYELEASLGVEENMINNDVVIFPNPVNKILSIRGTNTFNTVTISGINGRLLKEISFPQAIAKHEIDISNLSNGIYFLEIISGASKQILRFIKE